MAGTDLVLLVVEPRLQRLDHGVLGEGPRQPRQVRHLRQPGPPHLLSHGPLPPPRALAEDKDHFNRSHKHLDFCCGSPGRRPRRLRQLVRRLLGHVGAGEGGGAMVTHVMLPLLGGLGQLRHRGHGADVGVVVLEAAALRHPGPHAAQGRGEVV